MTKKRTITKDEKSLFLDLSSRLLYGVICQIDGVEKPHKLTKISINDFGEIALSFFVKEERGHQQEFVCTLGQIKPYLRSMEDMTENERDEYFSLKMQETERVALAEVYRPEAISEIMYWLLEKHFNVFLPESSYIRVTQQNNPYDRTEYKECCKR